MDERREYLENKSRQNNMRIFDMPEKSEGNNMIAFLNKFFNEVLKITGNCVTSSEHTMSTEKAQIRPD